jgi:tetratricopeptide (TPR) repeat protein
VPALADPIAKARELHEQGRTAAAIAQLRRIAPDHPSAAEAQSLVSQWEAISEEAEEPALSLAASLRRREAIEQAQAAADAGRNVEARSLLGWAGELAPLAGVEAELLERVRGSLRPFDEQLALFEDGEYELVLNQLWRRREAEKGNPDLDRLIVDAYYNLGVLDLQRGDPGAALEKFREARKLDGEDPALARLERFASVYAQRGEDLLYRIYVKYLQPR